jgi:HK97 family phage prohead protease
MPETTEKFHWIPVRSADLFVQESFRQITISEERGIHARIGKLKSDPDGSTVIQSYYFDKDKWSMEQAKEWVSDHKKSIAQGIQRRYVECITRMDYTDQKNPKIEGHAAVFNKRAEIWPGFWEQVAPGAFAEAIHSEDVYALWNHDPNNVLGNTGAKTLTLNEDDKGLKYEITPPDTTLGRDLTTLIKRGDVRKSSFGFNIEEEKITHLDEGKGVLRTILRVKPLYDVSPVTFPAYPQTDVHVRMIAGQHEILYWSQDSDSVLVQPIDAVLLPQILAHLTTEDFIKQIEDLKKRVLI